MYVAGNFPNAMYLRTNALRCIRVQIQCRGTPICVRVHEGALGCISKTHATAEKHMHKSKNNGKSDAIGRGRVCICTHQTKNARICAAPVANGRTYKAENSKNAVVRAVTESVLLHQRSSCSANALHMRQKSCICAHLQRVGGRNGVLGSYLLAKQQR